MKKFSYSLFAICYLALSLSNGLLFTVPSYAQGPDPFSLGISPPILEINADPPARVESIIHLENLSENTQDLTILFKSFRSSEDGTGRLEYFTGDMEIVGPDPLILQKVKVYDRETPIEKLVLDPFEVKDLSLKIDLEQGSPLGDYYFSVIFLSSSESISDQSRVQSPGGIGTNVILSVGKKGPTRGEILAFRAPFFVGSGPVPFTLLLRNNSDHYVTPRGRITIKNMLGQDVGRINILPQYILSNSERYIIDTEQASPSAKLERMIENLARKHNVLIWQERFLFGIYTANAHIKLSAEGPEFDTTIRFFAMPVYVVFALSFFAFVLLGIWLRVKRKI